MPNRSPLVRSFALALVCVSLCGCAHKTNARARRAAPTAAPVAVIQAKNGSVESRITVAGIIAPLQNVAISSALSEPVDSVRVLQGARVEAGQVLAVLNTSDIAAQLQQAQGTLQSNLQNAASADAKVAQSRYNAKLTINTANTGVSTATAALQQAQKTLQNDQVNLVRDRQLVTQGYIAQQALDLQQTTVSNDEAAVRTAEANVAAARVTSGVNRPDGGLQAATIADAAAVARSAHASVEIARGQVAQYQAQISRATIVSPVNGIVVNRNINPGEYPGSRTLFTVQKLDQVYANLNASSSDTFSIPIGAKVLLAVSGAGGRQYASTVKAVLGQVAPGSTNFTIQTIVENPDGRLQAGLPVSATITLPKVTGIAIPTTAFLDDSHTSVMTVQNDEDEGKIAHLTTVHERASDTKTSIVTGVASGTTIVGNGQLGLSDGQSISQ